MGMSGNAIPAARISCDNGKFAKEKSTDLFVFHTK